jgi:hypothetical protein
MFYKKRTAFEKVLFAIGYLLIFVGIPVAVGNYLHSFWLGLATFMVLSLVLLAIAIKQAEEFPYDDRDLD